MSERVVVEQHRADVAELLAALADRPAEQVPLDQGVLGRVLARDVTAPGPLPRFRNSQMDGFAVRAADVATAGPGAPVTLPVTGDVAAAPGAPAPLAPGTAVRIMTGAPVPEGADAVVPVEDTDHVTFNGAAAALATTVVVARARTAGEFVREPGSDVAADDVVLPAGTVLAPHHVAAAAACGVAHLALRAQVSVAVVSTGSELVGPGGEPGPGQIWDANGPALAAAVQAAGGRVGERLTLVDDPAAVRAGLERAAAGCDLVLTTGGVSQGAYEVVKDALTGLPGKVSTGVPPIRPNPCGPPGCIATDRKTTSGRASLTTS